MRRYEVTLILLILLLPRALGAIDMSSDVYGSVSDYLLQVYGIDNNAGLTALPVLNVPMGGRSEGMGTAFSAVADDASFIEWNPAGSSMLDKTELAFFHNNWIADTKIEGAVYSIRFDNLGLSAGGKWLYLPFTEYNQFGDRASKGYYSESVGILNASYNFFSGYYFSGLSVGANLKGAFRSVPDYSNDRGSVISGSGAQQSAFAPMADLGALTRFNLFKFYYAREKNASWALVFRNIGPPVLGDPLPSVMTTGISYKPIRPVLLSFDFSVPINLQDPSLSETPYWAVGCSVATTQFLTMRTGLLAKTGNVRFTLGSTVALESITLDINYTLDLLTQLQPLNRVSLAVRFDLGDRGRAEKAAQVDSFYIKGLEAYAQGNLKEAEQNWVAALKLDSTFDPAKEGLNALLGANKLEEKINQIQKIE